MELVETAGTLVADALTELTIQAQEQDVPPVDLNTGIRYLNRMMAGWSAKGIKLGYTVVSAPNDVLTVPAGAIEGMVFNLALRLANGFDVPISQSLIASAADSLNTIRILAVKPGKSAYPASLPIGSGNEGGGDYYGSHFYPDCCEDTNPCSSGGNGGDTNGL